MNKTEGFILKCCFNRIYVQMFILNKDSMQLMSCPFFLLLLLLSCKIRNCWVTVLARTLNQMSCKSNRRRRWCGGQSTAGTGSHPDLWTCLQGFEKSELYI